MLDFALLDLEYFLLLLDFAFFRSSSEVSLGEIWYARVPNLVVRKLDVE